MKHAANWISVTRIAFIPVLLLSFRFTPLFVAVYLLCGLSDVLDGFVARKTKTASAFGARLDSAADGLFCALIVVYVLSKLPVSGNAFIFMAVAAAAIRGVNLAFSASKYGEPASLHTWGNKLTGVFLFAAPLFVAYGWWEYLWLPCSFAVLSAAEESLIHATSVELDLNRKTFFRNM
ncbi:CDP-alcohol phosphatidyltransferase family protein [Gorillibacterium massiliense]|uniref:CDP-alcohol phosphatidyltransferase family protein n=1 Tax=Gorillibacterium massiliense TaxID=1280390 RepID=UPI0004BBA19E|nr:CDP-alcohol phosphatidyltransferase family protein [Gorillibacterium massiliense]